MLCSPSSQNLSNRCFCIAPKIHFKLIFNFQDISFKRKFILKILHEHSSHNTTNNSNPQYEICKIDMLAWTKIASTEIRIKTYHFKLGKLIEIKFFPQWSHFGTFSHFDCMMKRLFEQSNIWLVRFNQLADFVNFSHPSSTKKLSSQICLCYGSSFVSTKQYNLSIRHRVFLKFEHKKSIKHFVW